MRTPAGLPCRVMMTSWSSASLRYRDRSSLTSESAIFFIGFTESLEPAGSLGLAPQWGMEGGKCDTQCQRWVSACVLSRVDFLGVAKPIPYEFTAEETALLMEAARAIGTALGAGK